MTDFKVVWPRREISKAIGKSNSFEVLIIIISLCSADFIMSKNASRVLRNNNSNNNTNIQIKTNKHPKEVRGGF